MQMGFSPLLLHQLTKLSHLPLYTALVVSLVAVRIVLRADSEKPLSWRECHQASTVNLRVYRSVWKSLPLLSRHCDRRSLMHESRRGIFHAIWRRWYLDLISQMAVMMITSSA